MSVLHKITMFRSKLWDDPVELTYAEEPLRKAQARFVGRTVLSPQIDLKAYQWSAVIDWIDVEFELVRRTQYWKLNERIERLTGRKEFPEALNEGPGKTATRYKLRVQEPDLRSLRLVIDDLKMEYGFASPAVVRGLEVSIDAYPKTPCEMARARLHGVLIRHFFPTTQVLAGNLKWPRFMPGLVKGTDYTVSRNQASARQDVVDRMTPSSDRSPLYESTYYVGERNDPRASWRIQNKVLDRQNKAAGTRTMLSDDRKRVRIEVTLGPEGCKEVELAEFDCLGEFSLAKLQKRFFQFMKPTFGIHRSSGSGARSSAVRQRVEDLRRQRFLNAGVLGLQIRDDATLDFRSLEMANFRSWHKARGTRMQKRTRRGLGPYGTMVAYDELTRLVERALADLQRRVRKELRG